MKNQLTKMVGPFPIGVWLLIVVGGLGVAYVLQRGTKSSGGDSADGEDAGPVTAGVPFLPYGATVLGIDNSRDEEQQADTNARWVDRMIVLLGAAGYDRLAVQSALLRYVQGAPLSAAECAIVQVALVYGLPPEPVPAADCAAVESRPQGRAGDPDNPLPRIDPDKPVKVEGEYVSPRDFKRSRDAGVIGPFGPETPDDGPVSPLQTLTGGAAVPPSAPPVKTALVERPVAVDRSALRLMGTP